MADHKVPPVGGWRTPHGAAKKSGAEKVFEPVPDGVRPAPIGSADPLERRNNGTFTPQGAAAAARMRHEAAKVPDFGDRTMPWLPPSSELEPFDAARQDLLRQRRKELHESTGAVSSGVGAMLRAWAYIHSAGEYWASEFYATGDPQAFQRMVGAFKASSTEDAKLRDAAAWEAQARQRANPGLSATAQLQRQLREASDE